MPRFAAILFLIILIINSFSIPVFAATEPKLIKVDEEKKEVLVEINGKTYAFDLKQAQEVTGTIEITEEISTEKAETQENTTSSTENTNYTDLEKQYAALAIKEDRFTGLPSVMSMRLYTMQTDRLMKRGRWGLDFTHRFSSSFAQDNDLFGFDSFAYNSFGAHYGISDRVELHAMRANIGDSYELGMKAKLLQETKDFSLSHPFNVTLHSGFQNDNLQNSIDPYLQLIVSRSIIPKRVQVYASPIYAWRTNSINSGGSSSGIYSASIDKNGFSRGNEGTLALPLGLAIEVLKNKATLVGEIIPILNGFHENNMGWSTGLQFLSRRETHIWTIGLSNMPYVTSGQAIVGGPDDHLHLGFNVDVFL
jgi:hypothetical protein